MNKNKGYYLVLSTAIISGFAIFINQFGVKVSHPYVFTFLKNTMVAVLLFSLILILKDRKQLTNIKKKQWLQLILIGLIGGSIPFLLFFKGLSLTTSIGGAFLHKTIFIYIALFAAIFLKEKISKKYFLGGLFLVLGNLFLLKQISFSIDTGSLLILLATLFWAVENVISKYVLRELPGKVVALGRMFFGSLFIFLFLLFSGQAPLLMELNLIQIGWVSLTGLLLFGYVITWYSGLKYIPVSKAAVILLLGSPITSLLYFIQTGQITYPAILGIFLIAVGAGIALGLKPIYRYVRA